MSIDRFFAFEGRFTYEGADGEDHLLTGDELEALIEHVQFALNVYESHGFRFNDVTFSASLADGTCRFDFFDRLEDA